MNQEIVMSFVGAGFIGIPLFSSESSSEFQDIEKAVKIYLIRIMRSKQKFIDTCYLLDVFY